MRTGRRTGVQLWIDMGCQGVNQRAAQLGMPVNLVLLGSGGKLFAAEHALRVHEPSQICRAERCSTQHRRWAADGMTIGFASCDREPNTIEGGSLRHAHIPANAPRAPAR